MTSERASSAGPFNFRGHPFAEVDALRKAQRWLRRSEVADGLGRNAPDTLWWRWQAALLSEIDEK